MRYGCQFDRKARLIGSRCGQRTDMSLVRCDQIFLNLAVQRRLHHGVLLCGLKDLPGATFAQAVADQDACFAIDEGIER